MNTDTKNNLCFVIPDDFANQRLDQSLAKLMPEYSRTQIQEWIEEGRVLMNERVIKSKIKVKGGEIISVTIDIETVTIAMPEAIPLSIVYEDDALLIIHKPIGMIVHPGAGNPRGTLLNALLHYEPNLQFLPRAGILHRLDKDTSGLLVVAKTNLALKHLSQQIKKRTLLREYQAVVCGVLISGATINAAVERHPRKRKQMAVSDTGKPAVTHYRVSEKYRAHSLLKIRLETGRTHQIRVHLAHIHHPIVGDMTYGKRLQLNKRMTPQLIEYLRHFKHQALHAFALGLTHPITSEWLRFEIDLPEDMQHLIMLLREDHKRNPE